ncbi:MAG: TonB-dependent receptor [Flavobacteriaceae bacterium]|nr:MAG: TonB-dependent receptor [Flavobacteriaceae bacterium]
MSIEGTQLSTGINLEGKFTIKTSLTGDYILFIISKEYVSKRIPIVLEGKTLNLGIIYLEKDITHEKGDNLITLTDADLSDHESISTSSGLLQATRDVFLTKSAFDFGQAFFRVRGYGSQYGKVLVNGIPMNKIYEGRPQWNNWGGLNDVTKNQVFTNGLNASDYNFGSILGTTNMDTRPSGLRPGTRLSSSYSNRTYTGRFMATYNSGIHKNGLGYVFSASRRWAKKGYVDGTLYDAFSFFGALEFQFNPKHSVGLTSILASNRRGRSSAITEEVFELVGSKYNPYWGLQNGDLRNSRERKIVEPIFMLNHYYKSDKLNINSGIAYQTGTYARSRLGYFNAPNPDPTYYRYVPSFFINSPIGANFIGASLAKKGFLEQPQWNWESLYDANLNEVNNGKASYILYDDAVADNQVTMNSIANLTLNEKVQLDFGVTYKQLESDNYAKMKDVLGADFHLDVDPFSNTKNDMNGATSKTENELFNYHYKINSEQTDAFVQFKYTSNKWNVFVSGNYNNTSYKRDGLFPNERFIDNSLGKSEDVVFSNYGIKGGLGSKITDRHWLRVNAAYINTPPVLQNVFINPRENNAIVPNIKSEKIMTADLNYFIRLPKLTGRITGFHTRFQNMTDVNFFFVDAGVGSDFVQEGITNLDKLHMGTEVGLEYQASSSVKLTVVTAISKYVYASNPDITINFDTAGAVEDIINPDGNIALGIAKIKDYKLAQGPQKAMAFGVGYRDPKYWWVGATANYLGNNYANISTIIRTQSFYLDPDSGHPFPNATKENVSRLLAQRRLGNFYLLNLVGGKSWLINGKYISVFTSINNVFDTVYRTGGYEQSRNGNFGQLKQDNLSGTPSFAPKYWYGYGRTYFLNFAIGF